MLSVYSYLSQLIKLFYLDVMFRNKVIKLNRIE